ncbi:heterokaryon incompatibility protein-domain-containing protein [Cercophora samala]|uniref:Heterokaryon incompatibility protein-domain-containing protein n=1 Tax=Cercophora samala TaxID=330535 RepID=A0AA40D8M6_9PEZI|nr:heterokaryon incompatibility protein-domain-containing protein [Cercophora samala]
MARYQQGKGLDMMDTVEINGRTYVSTDSQRDSRKYRSKVLLWNDLDFQKLPKYEYNKLSSMQRRIRLLRLEGGGHGNPEISCELFEVDFDREHGVQLTPSSDNQNGQPAANGTTTPEVNGNTTAAGSKEPFDYEALSWCWGVENKDFGIRVKKGGKTYRLPVTRELALALKYLRRTNHDRVLWIDAICIDQENHEERNHQVQMMSLIYTSASQVCVWLGEDNDDSATAISFIHEIMQLENFDAIAANKDNATKWQSLLLLMQRPWFSRRWVVQEIALARKATIYCGKDEIAWQNFAVAVELFVEVETATHRLSEVMQKTEAFNHVPQWFEHVSELGASVLVQATGKVFRRDAAETHSENVSGASPPHQEVSNGRQPSQRRENVGIVSRKGQKSAKGAAGASGKEQTGQSIPPRPLLGLEYLVSSLSVFEATQPRDAVYSLLAIARDTTPMAELSTATQTVSKDAILMMTVSSFLERKPFRVDYARPYSDICKDFISFCIQRAQKTDPIRALDIICRPWAPTPQPFGPTTTVVHKKPIPYKYLKKGRRALWIRPPGPSKKKKSQWIPGTVWNEETKEQKEERIGNLDPEDRTLAQYYAEIKSVAPEDEIWLEQINRFLPKKKTPAKREISRDQYGDSDDEEPRHAEQNDEDQDFEKAEEAEDIELPSWVSRISGAAFALYHHPGMQSMKRMGRKNADPLVGLPQDGHRNYSAAQNTKVNLQKLRFRKRPTLRHHSLYVEGFVLDMITEVKEPARLGAIPETWAQLAKWDDAVEGTSDPPAEFWRTLVADRGKDNRNPPYYYATACKESVKKGGLRGGSVDTGALIASERNSIIAEFCRRVQAVIWNRCMIKTELGTLGLASQDVRQGDLVCIIFGCSVPVILRPNQRKSEQELADEKLEDDVAVCRKFVSRVEESCFRKLRYANTKKTKAREEASKRKAAAEVEKKAKSQKGKVKNEDGTQRLDELEQEKERGEGKSKKGNEVKKDGEASSWEKIVKEETDIINDQMMRWKKADEESKQRKKEEDEDSKLRKEKAARREKDRRTPKVSTSPPPAGPPRPKHPQYPPEEDKYYWYTLLGEAYIHGMMDGEAIREHIIEGLPKRCIEIR